MKGGIMRRYQGSRRCLKFTGYIYAPMTDDRPEIIRDFAVKLGSGRLMIYNEVNQRTGHMRPFNNIGTMLKMICDEFSRRSRRRVPRPRRVR
jgi:hypothetical protein